MYIISYNAVDSWISLTGQHFIRNKKKEKYDEDTIVIYYTWYSGLIRTYALNSMCMQDAGEKTSGAATVWSLLPFLFNIFGVV